ITFLRHPRLHKYSPNNLPEIHSPTGLIYRGWLNPKNVHTLCLISFDDYLSGSPGPALDNLVANP
ncbi:MAG: hypothetical protein KA099_10220, partial [Alphaproteobacteria bacterium]|nr:hypothetical protein [Alphaproteobacteria bacterium]